MCSISLSKAQYQLNGEHLRSVSHQRDLGVIVDETLKPHRQCVKAAKRHHLWISLFDKLYGTLIRPHLEYSAQAWRLWPKKGHQAARRRPEAPHQTCEGPPGHQIWSKGLITKSWFIVGWTKETWYWSIKFFMPSWRAFSGRTSSKWLTPLDCEDIH